MTDKIFIHGLALHAHHGVLPYEAKVGQSFTIDLMLEIDLSTAKDFAPGLPPDREQDSTTHCTAMDSDGNIVAIGGLMRDEILLRASNRLVESRHDAKW